MKNQYYSVFTLLIIFCTIFSNTVNASDITRQSITFENFRINSALSSIADDEYNLMDETTNDVNNYNYTEHYQIWINHHPERIDKSL